MFPCFPAVLPQHNISHNTVALRSVIRKRTEGLQSAESFLESLRHSAAPRMFCTCSQNEKNTGWIQNKGRNTARKKTVPLAYIPLFYKKAKRNTDIQIHQYIAFHCPKNMNFFCIHWASFWVETRLICVSYAQHAILNEIHYMY